MRNLCTWWIPFSSHVTNLHDINCMLKLIQSHSRLNIISKSKWPLNDVFQPWRRYFLIGGVEYRCVYLTSLFILCVSNVGARKGLKTIVEKRSHRKLQKYVHLWGIQHWSLNTLYFCITFMNTKNEKNCKSTDWRPHW